jgi:hypothetical protein
MPSTRHNYCIEIQMRFRGPRGILGCSCGAMPADPGGCYQWRHKRHEVGRSLSTADVQFDDEIDDVVVPWRHVCRLTIRPNGSKPCSR